MTRPAGSRRRAVGRELAGHEDTARRPAASTRPAEPIPLDEDGPSRWWRHLAWPVIVLVLGTAGMVAAGVPAWRAAVIGVAGAGALWAVIVSLAVASPVWYYDVPLATTRTPTSWEVPGLIGARQSSEWFADYLRPRLWALAQELLRRRGIDPGSAAARRLVGRRDYALLTGADADPRRTVAAIPALCHTIARLGVESTPQSPAPVRNPVLAGLAGAPRRAPRRAVRRPRPEGSPR